VSVRVMAAVWELDLPPMEKLVLLALADWSNDEGKCWPSATRLAAKTGEGERTVRRVIQSLIGKGFLYQELRSGTSPIYTVDPCQSGTPARAAPLPHRPQTPARAAPKPLGTIIRSEAKASSLWHPLPVDWVPTRPLSAKLQSAVELWPPGALESELESFSSWARNAEPKQGKGLKKDWDDALGNWLRRAHRDTYSRQRMERPRTNPLVDLYRSTIEPTHPANCDGAGPALPAIGNR
jgi:hypothetical protein